MLKAPANERRLTYSGISASSSSKTTARVTNISWKDEIVVDSEAEKLLKAISNCIQDSNVSLKRLICKEVETFDPNYEDEIEISNAVRNSPSISDITSVHDSLLSSLPNWSSARNVFMRYPIWFTKNNFHNEMPDESRLRHSFTCLLMAYHLSSKFKVLDVDSIFLPQFPKPSDITIMTEDDELIYLDITTSLPSEAKLSNLVSSSSRILVPRVKSVICAVLQFETKHIYPNATPPDKISPVVWGHSPEAVVSRLQPLFREMSKEECSSLYDTLDSILSPALTAILPSTRRNDNLVDSISTISKELFGGFIKANRMSESEAKEIISKLITGEASGVVKAWSDAVKSLPHELKQDKFVKCGFKGVNRLKKLKKFKTPAPITSLNNPLTEIGNLYEHDTFLWVGIESRKKNESWKQGDDTILTFLSSGQIIGTTNPHMAGIDFDERQSIKNAFRENVVAYVKLLPYKTSEGKFQTPSYFQLLFNPRYSHDENLKDYINRNSLINGSKSKKEWIELSEEDESSEDYVERLAKDLLASPLEIIAQSASVRSTRFKSNIVFKKKTNPSVSELSCLYEDKMSSLLINYSDAMSSQARAYSVVLNAKHPENCVCVLESADYASVGIWYLSGTYPSFRTTWRKIYNIVETKDLSLYDVGDLSPLISNSLLSYRSSRLRISLDKSFLKIMENSPRFVKASVARAEIVHGGKLQSLSRDLLLVSTKFSSVDKMHLEWEIELPYKLMTRLASLCEYRHKLYSEFLEPDNIMKEPLDLIEINWNLLSFIPNRQQFSVISTAWRYLHQGLGSLDFDPNSTLNKLDGLSVKSHIEMSYLQRMVSIYKLSMVLRSLESINTIRATNREVFVSAPDLLMASNSPNINVSSYSTPNLLNVSKQWRISSEAACVQAAWEQTDSLREIINEDVELWYGMPAKMYNDLLSSTFETSRDLISYIKDNSQALISHTEKLLAHKSPKNYASNFWFEVMTHMKLRVDKGTFKAQTALAGRDLKAFLTMRGSTISTELKSPLENVAVRKATALLVLLARLKKNDPGIIEAGAMVGFETKELETNVDQLGLLDMLLRTPYVRDITPICQFSEKDAPGKDREISTLNIEFGMLCLLCEKIAQPFSALIPEDLVTHSAKEWSIYKSVLRLEKIRETDETKDVLYVNQDKSKYGPNRKVSSMLLSAAILSEDDYTYQAFELSLYMSSRKMISYPHDLVRQSLRIVSSTQRDAEGRKRVLRQAQATKHNMPYYKGKTSEVMIELFRQYEGYGNYGPLGSTWVSVREGMPGQGIFTTLSSISHASAQRYFSAFVGRELGWVWDSRVTSDDSMTMILHPKSQNLLIHNGIQRLISGLTYQMGLIENKAKMTITARRPEMNTFYMLRGEPVCAVWKFMNAYCSITSSGNIGEDLLACVSKGSDLLRFGGSVFVSSFLSAVLVSMTLDAYRFWGPYLTIQKTSTEEPSPTILWDMPVELFGLPNLDPISSIVSPIGTRMNTALSKWLSREDADNYSRVILEMNLSSSKVDQDQSSLDQYGNKITDGLITYSTKDGLVTSSIGTLPPTVNGLIGMLYRRKKDIKVAKELSPIFRAFNKIESYKGWTIKNLLQNIPFFFDVPAKMGHSERSILENYTEIAHNPDYKFLKVSPNSFLPATLRGTSISMNDLKDLLKGEENIKKMSTSFRERLMVKSNFPPALESMASELNVQAKAVLDIHDMLSTSKLKPNDVKRKFCEHSKEDALGKLAFKRLLKISVGMSRKETIYLNGIRNEIMSKYVNCLPAIFPEIKASPITPKGEMDELDAYHQTRVTLERIKSLIPRPSIVYSETQGGVRSSEADLYDWLRFNAFTDHHFSVPEDSLKVSGLNTVMASSLASSNSEDINCSSMLSYVNGMLTNNPTYSLEVQPVTKRLIPCEAGARVALPLPINPSEEELQIIYNSGQVVSLSFSSGILLDSSLINGLWYGGPLDRVKVEDKIMIDSEEGTCWAVTTTRFDSVSDKYEHTTVVWLPAAINTIRPGSKLESRILSLIPLVGISANDLIKGVYEGEDYYSVVVFNSKSLFVLGLNFSDYFLKDLDSNLSFPVGRQHNFSEFGTRASEILKSLTSSRRRTNLGPKYRTITKIPITSLSERDSSDWAETLSNAIEVDGSPENVLTMIDLASSFFVSGKPVRVSVLKIRTPAEFVTTRELGRKIMRLYNFRKLSREFEGSLIALPAKFYSAIEEHVMSKIMNETLSLNKNLSLTLNRGLDEDIVRIVPKDSDPGEESLLRMAQNVNPLVEAFQKLINSIPESLDSLNAIDEVEAEAIIEIPKAVKEPISIEDVTEDMINSMEDVEIEFDFEV
jgi:hypothetical protein